MEYLKQTERFLAGRRENDLPPKTRDFMRVFIPWVQDKIYKEITKRVNHLLGYQNSKIWDPGNITTNDMEVTTITVEGAELGDFAIASFSLDTAGLALDAEVTSANTVTVELLNVTGGSVDLGSGTLRVKVIPK